MKIIDWTDEHNDAPIVGATRDWNKYTWSAERVIVGNCPDCTAPLVVFNDHESWPLVACKCGWRGATTEFDSARYERGVEPEVRSA